jgi:hypothetical protein
MRILLIVYLVFVALTALIGLITWGTLASVVAYAVALILGLPTSLFITPIAKGISQSDGFQYLASWISIGINIGFLAWLAPTRKKEPIPDQEVKCRYCKRMTPGGSLDCIWCNR